MPTYYQRPPTSDEIYHHGILGQKWGIRRYQNKDGTLTAAGKARKESIKNGVKKGLAVAGAAAGTVATAAAGVAGVKKSKENDNVRKRVNKLSGNEDNGNKSKVSENAFKSGKDGKPSRVEKMARSSNDLVSEAQKTYKNSKQDSIKRQNYEDVRKMSDKELNAKIDRMAREKRYRELKYEQDLLDKGSDKTDKVLQYLGTATVLASSVATIASAIYQIKHGEE